MKTLKNWFFPPKLPSQRGSSKPTYPAKKDVQGHDALLTESRNHSYFSHL